MILKSKMAVKLHGLRVTQTHLHYSGSISLPASVCADAGLCENDQVAVYNFDNGARYETYVLLGEEAEVSINGPSARLCSEGHRIVVVQYVLTNEEIGSRVLFFDAANRPVPADKVFADAPGTGS